MISLVCAFVTATDALKVLDFSKLSVLWENGVTLKTFVNYELVTKDFVFLKAAKGFAELNWGYVGAIAVAYVPVAFVVFAEHIADHKNISSIIGKDLLKDPGLSRTLLGDGVGSMAGALLGGCPNTTYGESVACVAITRNASVVTILATAILAMLVSFFSPFVAFVNSIPQQVGDRRYRKTRGHEAFDVAVVGEESVDEFADGVGEQQRRTDDAQLRGVQRPAFEDGLFHHVETRAADVIETVADGAGDEALPAEFFVETHHGVVVLRQARRRCAFSEK